MRCLIIVVVVAVVAVVAESAAHPLNLLLKNKMY